jgi:hypothetical protein
MKVEVHIMLTQNPLLVASKVAQFVVGIAVAADATVSIFS